MTDVGDTHTHTHTGFDRRSVLSFRRPERLRRRISNPSPFHGVRNEVFVNLPRRDDCPGCNAQRDEHGRLPIGHCGPDCLGAVAKRMAAEMRRTG